MYPRLWQVSGLSYSALIDKLLKLALERKLEQEKKQQQIFEFFNPQIVLFSPLKYYKNKK